MLGISIDSPMEYTILQLIFASITQPVVSAVNNQTLVLQVRPDFVFGLVILDYVPINQRVF